MEKQYDTIAERDKLRKANHKYYELVAEVLNDSGIDMQMLLKDLREYGRVRCTKNNIKDIYRSIGRQKFGITSTQELTTIQAIEVEKEFTQAIQETKKVVLPPFPSEESILMRERMKEYDQNGR